MADGTVELFESVPGSHRGLCSRLHHQHLRLSQFPRDRRRLCRDNSTSLPVLDVHWRGAAGQGAFTGVFQNRFNPSANAIWTLGKHTITFGGSFAYTQLNTRDERDQLGMIASQDLTNFLVGNLTPNNSTTSPHCLLGIPIDTGAPRKTANMSRTSFNCEEQPDHHGGTAFRLDGGLTEKNGNLFNFDPSKYSYDPTTDTITSNGLDRCRKQPERNARREQHNPTGRQWGFAPRLGVAWSPKMFNSKIVVRAGWGMYYDRGELLRILSPGVAQNITAAGRSGSISSSHLCARSPASDGQLRSDSGEPIRHGFSGHTTCWRARVGYVLPNACTFANFDHHAGLRRQSAN